MSGDQRDAPDVCPCHGFAIGGQLWTARHGAERPQLEELHAPLLERLRWLSAHFPDSVTGAACGEAASELERLRSMSQTDSEAITLLTARVAELESALQRYGGHLAECQLRVSRLCSAPCSCGFSEALSSSALTEATE